MVAIHGSGIGYKCSPDIKIGNGKVKALAVFDKLLFARVSKEINYLSDLICSGKNILCVIIRTK